MDKHYLLIRDKVINNNKSFIEDNFFIKNINIKFCKLNEVFINELDNNNIFHVYNFLKILENYLENNKLTDEIIKFWNENFKYNANKFNDKNVIINLILKINKIISNYSIFKKNLSSLNNNIKSIKNKNNNQNKKFTKISPSKQFNSPFVCLNKDEIENFNIKTINNEIKLISIDLFLLRIIDGKYSENFLKKFIYQSFQFISYDILIKKIVYLCDNINQNKNIFYIKNFLNLILEFISDKQENKINNLKLSNEILLKIKFQKTLRKSINIKNNKSIINKEKITNFNLLEIPSKIFALILTNYTNSLFIKLQNEYYQLNSFCLKNKKLYSPIINDLINLSNNIVRFLMEEIISYDNKKKRNLVIKKIIEIAEELNELHNLNDLFAISNMFYTIEANLRMSFNLLEKKYLDKINFMKNLCNPLSKNLNIKNETLRLKNKNLNFTQLLGITLSDIINKDDFKYVNNGLIDLRKIEVIDEIIFNFIDNLKYCKIFKVEREYKKYENIINFFLNNLKPKSFDDLIDFCSKLEPKFLLKKKSDKKRLTETQLSIISNYY